MKKLIIIGESHTRQFAYRDNVIPLFSGNGKNINLDNPTAIQDKIDKVVGSKKYGFEKITFLYIGEPNCRIKLTNHWTPHWDELQFGKQIFPKVDEVYLNRCIEAYVNLNLAGVDFILTPTAAYDPIIPSLICFNDLLKDRFGDKVIDVFTGTYDENKRVKEEFKASNWREDPIHLNSKVSETLLLELERRDVIENASDYALQTGGHFGTHIVFEKDKTKFGTYLIK